APLEKIRSNLATKVLKTLDEMKRNEAETYNRFYDELGVFLKEGVGHDWDHREQLADLLLFESTKTEAGKRTSLSEYVERMPASQNEIFYLIGETRELLEQSPLLEAFRAEDREVLLMTDPADEFVTQALHEYKGKRLKAADRGALDQGEIGDDVRKQF